MAKVHVRTTINGEPAEFLCEPADSLLDALRDAELAAAFEEQIKNNVYMWEIHGWINLTLVPATALTDFYNGVALLAMPFDPELTMVMTGPCRSPKEDESPDKVPSVAENCARTLDEAAQHSESLRRMLANFTTVSVWGAVIAAHLPILAIVAKNHTPLGEKADPAKAMEAVLRREAAKE